jgi:preprotein translocase subunit SecE
MRKLVQFIREVLAEFKNITWPKRDTLIQLTVVVISISIVISLILGGFDYIFTNSISLLGKAQIQPKQNVEQVQQNLVPTITATVSASPTVKPTITLKK